MARSNTVVASRWAKVVAGAGSVRSSAGQVSARAGAPAAWSSDSPKRHAGRSTRYRVGSRSRPRSAPLLRDCPGRPDARSRTARQSEPGPPTRHRTRWASESGTEPSSRYRKARSPSRRRPPAAGGPWTRAHRSEPTRDYPGGCSTPQRLPQPPGRREVERPCRERKAPPRRGQVWPPVARRIPRRSPAPSSRI